MRTRQILYYGSSSKSIDIRSCIKQGCVLPPILFRIFYLLLNLLSAFGSSTEEIYLHTRSDRRLSNLACLRAQTKVSKVLIRDLLFADEAAVTYHNEQQIQHLIDHFSKACLDFRLSLSFGKANVFQAALVWHRSTRYQHRVLGELADDCTKWQGTLHCQLLKGDQKFLGQADERRAWRKVQDSTNCPGRCCIIDSIFLSCTTL